MPDESQIWPLQKPMRDRVRQVMSSLSKKARGKLLEDALKTLDLIEERMLSEIADMAAEAEAVAEKEGESLQ